MDRIKRFTIISFTALCGLFLINIFPAFAQEEEGTVSMLDSLSRFKSAYNIGGSLKYKTFFHLYETEQDKRELRHEGILHLESSNDLTKNLSLYLGPEIAFDNAHFSSEVIDNFEDKREKRRYIVNLKEGYLAYYGEGFDFSLKCL